jgi:hypothetical protein
MGKVADRFPDDQDAQTLHADALMNLSPWYYWNSDGTPRPATPMLLKRLESVIAVNDIPRDLTSCRGGGARRRPPSRAPAS